MRTLSALLALAFLACGSPSGPEPPEPPTGPPSLAITQGDGQEVAVTDTLPFDAEVCASRGGEPVSDQLMDWRVLEDQAGEPFVTTTRTDSAGCTRNRVVAGTRAHTHPDLDGEAHMEVRWIDQSSGEAIVEETIGYLVLPGLAVDTVRPGTRIVGANAPMTAPADWLADQYDNPVPYRLTADSVFAVPSTDASSDSSRTLALTPSASDGDSAVVCAWGEDGNLAFPALAVVHDGGSDIALGVQGDFDPENDHGYVQPEDCR